ncbi:MAG: hypothetical protein AB7F22_11140 [Reyranella sp.]
MVLHQEIGDRLVEEVLQAEVALGGQQLKGVEACRIDVHQLAHCEISTP